MQTVQEERAERIEKLAIIWKKSGMSQQTIAVELGIAIQTVHNWLTKKRVPRSMTHLQALDRFIGKNSTYLS